MTTPALAEVPELPRPDEAKSSRLEVRPAPSFDGPYDDELPALAPRLPGSLVLAFPPPTRVSIPLRLVPPAGGVAVPGEPTHHDDLPDSRPWAGRLSQAIAEVLAGARAPGQLASVATLEVLAMLERGAGRLGARRGTPPQRPVVRSVHVCEPRAGVAEACAVVDTGARRRALALRLEGADGRWLCTALHVG